MDIYTSSINQRVMAASERFILVSDPYSSLGGLVHTIVDTLNRA